MRLFIAVDPPEEVLDLVEALPRPQLKSLRWTTRDQWHVTLRFLGDVADPAPVAASLRRVPAALQASGSGPFEAVLGPTVAWFTGRRILQIPVKGMELLARSVSSHTAEFGEPPDAKPFSGHLTLARVRDRARGPVNLAGIPIGATWMVNDMVLFSSSLGSGGARYSVLERVPLPL